MSRVVNGETTELITPNNAGSVAPPLNAQTAITGLTQRDMEGLVIKLEELIETIKTRGGLEQPRYSRTRRHRCFQKLWSLIVKYFLVVTTSWQIACIGLLSLVEAIRKTKEKELTNSLELSITILTFCQAVLIFVVICMSIKIMKQYMHMTLTPGFLFQAYLASILVFTGLYTLYVRISESSFRHVGEDQHGVLVFEVYIKMLFFSVSNATLCGVSLTYPNVWYSYVTVAIQMLLSFLYFASILSVVIDRRKIVQRERNGGAHATNTYGSTAANRRTIIDDQV